VQVKAKDPFTLIPAKIEAEAWSAMSGVQTENTADVEGGLNVGYIEAGDWMDYAVKVPTSGVYTIKLRLATPNSNSQVQIKKSDGTVLSTVVIPATGGYQTWKTVYTTVNLPQGNQTLRVTTPTGGWNFNWLEFLQGVVNQPPSSNAGPNQIISLPVNTVTLNGSGTDADGTVVGYSWFKIYGPQEGQITNFESAQTTVTGLIQATYVFRLTVYDDDGDISFDDVTIVVNPAAPPSAGPRIEAENWTAMNGVLTEATPDVGGGLNVGWIDNGDWMDYGYNAPSTGSYNVRLRIATAMSGAQLQIRKADGSILSTVNVPNTGGWQTWQTITTSINLTQGQQTLRIISTSAANWNINWLELELTSGGTVNQSPSVNAGADQGITLPASSVQLSGSATDGDGTIASYAWTQIAGPAGAAFSNSTAATTTVSGLTQGSYTFRLTATDNAGATGSDDVVIVVNPSSPNSFLAYIATTTTGTQNFGGELGMEFKVHNAAGIVVSQLGAFDHQGNGITGTQSGGIRVAIFNKSTKTIVPGLDVIIIGNADAYSGNHRMKNVPAVTLMPGDYMIVAKGYNANELNGNSGVGTPFAPGDLGNGAISYAATCAYGSTANDFVYPTNPDGGPGNRYLAGTFRYTKSTGPVPNTPPA
jgi:hypothetical protein